jgi:hypothetical protein
VFHEKITCSAFSGKTLVSRRALIPIRFRVKKKRVRGRFPEVPFQTITKSRSREKEKKAETILPKKNRASHEIGVRG